MQEVWPYLWSGLLHAEWRAGAYVTRCLSSAGVNLSRHVSLLLAACCGSCSCGGRGCGRRQFGHLRWYSCLCSAALSRHRILLLLFAAIQLGRRAALRWDWYLRWYTCVVGTFRWGHLVVRHLVILRRYFLLLPDKWDFGSLGILGGVPTPLLGREPSPVCAHSPERGLTITCECFVVVGCSLAWRSETNLPVLASRYTFWIRPGSLSFPFLLVM